MFADVIAPARVATLATDHRHRHYPHEITFWAFLSQTLSEDRSCARAVAEIQNQCHDHGLEIPSADTSSYCKARQRLPLPMLQTIAEDLRTSLQRATPSNLLWHGHIAKAIDGSSVQLPDTPANQLAYPQSANQQPGCGFPVMQFGALINLCNGAWEHTVVSPLSVHDHKLLHEMMIHIGAGEVLVSDRAFASYEMIARVQDQGAWTVTRLHQGRRTLNWDQGKKIGTNQRLVTWRKPPQPKGSCLTPEQWAALPAQLNVRLIQVPSLGRDGKSKTMYLVTTLLDTKAYPAEDIGALYQERWQMELRLRDLKTTMGMEVLRTQSPEMARKELTMFTIAYNALRMLMLQASLRGGVDLKHLSFKGTMQVTEAWKGRFRRLHDQPQARTRMMEHTLEQIAQRAFTPRSGRQEPRVKKRRPKPFPLMSMPRANYHAKWRQNTTHSPTQHAA
jgi:hypothetical protein